MINVEHFQNNKHGCMLALVRKPGWGVKDFKICKLQMESTSASGNNCRIVVQEVSSNEEFSYF